MIGGLPDFAQNPSQAPANKEKKVLTFAILGSIGSWWDEVGKKDIFRLLQNSHQYDEIHVIISSLGGAVGDGFVIYDLIAGHRCKTVALLTGQVASAATFLACAFDEVIVSKQCTYMIHRGLLGPGYSNAPELRKMADRLEKHDNRVVDIYARRTGLPSNLIMELMEEETWFEPDELVELGFADRVEDAISVDFTEEITVAGESGSGYDWFWKGEQQLADASRIVMRQRGFRPISNSAALTLKQKAASLSTTNRMKFPKLGALIALGLSFVEGKWKKGDQELSEAELAELPEVKALFDQAAPSPEAIQDAITNELPGVQSVVQQLVIDQLTNNEEIANKVFDGHLKSRVKAATDPLQTEINGLKEEIKQLKLGKKPAGNSNGTMALGTAGGTDPDAPQPSKYGDATAYLQKLLADKMIDQATFNRLTQKQQS